MMGVRLRTAAAVLAIVATATPAAAAWRAGSADVSKAVADARVAGALAAVNEIDRAAVSDDHAAFAALLTDDLVVNNPQNSISVRGATKQRSTAGQISYVSYDRVIEYAGMRGDMVLLMGEEIVLPRTPSGTVARPVHRRFSDLWKREAGRWKLTARQATVIPSPGPGASN
jgi:ketosteroid isomerase-like protein